jgi:hypothetical protein
VKNPYNTTEEIDQYTWLFKEFQDIFAWSYDVLKEYDKHIFWHVVPLKEGSKPFKKKLRMINPKINPLVKIELEKLKKVGINFSIRHSKWLSNTLVVIKKNGEIHICVYLYISIEPALNIIIHSPIWRCCCNRSLVLH